MNSPPIRCPWCGNDPLYQSYHDREWGVPVHDDRLLFEMLVLEGAQAGLSWLTILRKRPAYRVAFEQFDIATISRYRQQDSERLLNDPGIVRNRRKIEATIKNAAAALRVQDTFGSLDRFLWRFVDGRPQQHRYRSVAEIPPRTEASDRMSKALKECGFSFVGSTICYAFMQATGMVNDHLVDCFRYREVQVLAG